MEVLHLGNPVLREKSEPVAAVTQEIVQLVSDMFETMDMQRGVGLAAPQVGKLLRMFVITIDDGVRRVFINPQIIETSVETCEIEEGCLSIPDVWESITRPSRVTVQALDEHGRPFTIEADGYLARVIQHEYDHLDGVLYIDRGDAEFRDKTIAKFERRAERRRQKDAIKAAKAGLPPNRVLCQHAPKEFPGHLCSLLCPWLSGFTAQTLTLVICSGLD